MTDREKAGLRGPVKICVEENIYPTGTVSITTTSEYAIDGKLLVSLASHRDGSEWTTTHICDADGRLTKIVSGKLGEPRAESLYANRPAMILQTPTKQASCSSAFRGRYSSHSPVGELFAKKSGMPY